MPKITSGFLERWHISRNLVEVYIYHAGGSRNGTRVMLFALMSTMVLGGLWHGASWNFVLWGLLHGLLLVGHRYLKDLRITKKIFERLPTLAPVFGWIVTQYFVFMTWLVFRVEDTKILIPSLKTFVGIDAHWDTTEMYSVLPEIKFLTLGLGALFFIAHFVSWKLGGLKHWISEQNPVVWGLIIGGLMSPFMLRPAKLLISSILDLRFSMTSKNRIFSFFIGL